MTVMRYQSAMGVSDLAQYLYAKTPRGARELLEQRGALG